MNKKIGGINKLQLNIYNAKDGDYINTITQDREDFVESKYTVINNINKLLNIDTEDYMEGLKVILADSKSLKPEFTIEYFFGGDGEDCELKTANSKDIENFFTQLNSVHYWDSVTDESDDEIKAIKEISNSEIPQLIEALNKHTYAIEDYLRDRQFFGFSSSSTNYNPELNKIISLLEEIKNK